MMELVAQEAYIEDACVLEKTSCSDACVKNELSCSDACIKEESCPEATDAFGASVAAAATLYADHVVKNELVIGPELVQTLGQLQKEPEWTPTTYKCGLCSYTTAKKASLVNHEGKHINEKHFNCDTGSHYVVLQNHPRQINSRHKYGQCSYACPRKCTFHERKHTINKALGIGGQCRYVYICAQEGVLRIREKNLRLCKCGPRLNTCTQIKELRLRKKHAVDKHIRVIAAKTNRTRSRDRGARH